MTLDEIFAGESENVEYKEDIPPKSEKYMKTVVAFANGTGGKLIFGVQDETLEIVGFVKDEIFSKMDAITNAIYDSCEPRIMPNVAIQEVEGKFIIIAEIPAGMQRPYYIKNMGIMDGTYVRVSGTTRKAEKYMVQELILDGTNRSFDQMPQRMEVTEEQIADFCERMYQQALELCQSEEIRSQIQKISKNQLLSWKLLVEQNDKYYPTNGYLLLDGTCDEFPEATIQCAVFKGTVRDVFITRKEFSGSIYRQIEEAYQFVLQHLDLGARMEGLAREDIYELPIKTIRELISNAVCHRSYLSPGKIQVALFDDRLEVTSPGMLDYEMTIKKMRNGLSKIRNKGIASAFSYMKVIEGWGSGIPRMFREAEEYGLAEPELIDMGSDFRVNLYRRKLEVDRYGVISPKSVGKKENGTNGTIRGTNGTDADTILNLIRSNSKIKQREIHEQTGISLRTIKRIMAVLQQEGKIERKGNNRSGEWLVM